MQLCDATTVEFAVLCFGLGGSLLALACLIMDLRRGWHVGRYAACLLGIALAALAIFHWFAGSSPAFVGAAAALAIAFLTAWVARSSGTRRFLGRILDARLIWIGLLVICPLISFWWTRQLQPADSLGGLADATTVADTESTGARAVTDRGREIVLAHYALQNEGALGRREQSFLSGQLSHYHIVRTADPDANYNCHGWVFTDGRYNVSSTDVTEILEDNGYHSICQPEVGDLIVYRDEGGQVEHTGVVRFVAGRRFVLVESKWGPFGRYLHVPAAQPYGGHYSYYRSKRNGHLLRLRQSPRSRSHA